ncbi:glyoxalase superfamily protein [Pseudovibrio denitrificans]|uniref:glyoxalase superfamily protein n=1 Tax=Pseudovibrio denitrificans TaxID=258256 RepID=UPI0039BF9C0C
MNGSLPSLSALKAQAKQLRAALEKRGEPISHSQTLELIAHQHGYRDWNTLYAAVGNRPPVLYLRPGDRVQGKYLGQRFDAEVLGVQSSVAACRVRLTLQFDEAVDVVSFDSFSSFRHRVTCTLNADGMTSERTSDGEPHMVLSGL